MSKKVDKWLARGKKRCDKGDHWFVLDYGGLLVCPVCGHREIKSDSMTEYNCYIVTVREDSTRKVEWLTKEEYGDFIGRVASHLIPHAKWSEDRKCYIFGGREIRKVAG